MKNVNIIDRKNDAITKAKNLFTKNFGIIKPAYFNPLNSKALIDILEIISVKRYRITTFIKKENVPKVTKLRGRVMMLNIGFSVTNIKDKAAPPIIKESMPPDILTPGMNKVNINSDRE